jgi:hypothetical protein
LGIAALTDKIVQYYALYLWGEVWQKHITQGDRVVGRVANHFLVGFEYRTDAEWSLAALRGCLHRFWLELHTEKTRLMELGPHSIANRKQRGEGKPEVFNILGFTHICERPGRPATLPSAVRLRTSAWGRS